MKATSFPFSHRAAPRHRQRGASLLVWIGILAIVAIFAVVLLRALLREIDHSVAREETAKLAAYSRALQNWAMANGTIPGPVSSPVWATAVAAEVGVDAPTVATNPRRQPRYFMVDTNSFRLLDGAGGIAMISLPYVQPSSGLTNFNSVVNKSLFSPRAMLVSSLGEPLPNGINAEPSTAEFVALWNCREGQVPANGAWADWEGRADDIKIERIDLRPLFLDLRLSTSRLETSYGQFAIGATSPVYFAPPQTASSPGRYVLRGTKIWLYTSQSSGSYLDSRQILTKSSAYRYEDGIWKTATIGADLPGGIDLAGVVKGFLECVPNTNALNGAAQQLMVVNSMMDYMRGYLAWAARPTPFEESFRLKTMIPLQDAMMDRCIELFKDGGNEDNDFFPINLGGCE